MNYGIKFLYNVYFEINDNMCREKYIECDKNKI